MRCTPTQRTAHTPLDMAQQVSLEKLELRIVAMPQVQAQLKLSGQTYRDSTLEGP